MYSLCTVFIFICLVFCLSNLSLSVPICFSGKSLTVPVSTTNQINSSQPMLQVIVCYEV
uniref:Uncharacterized protein n=1 Tax=Anguilla anguilla TaxID=7936 RepID=A0A0E9U930_ANGAN